MAYTADDLRKMRERGTTRASSSDSKRKYTADDLMAMRGKSVQNETTSLYDSYAKQAVQDKYRYNSLDQYDKALEASKPADNKMKRIANAGIDFVNAINPTPATLKRIAYTDEEQAYNDLKTERNLYAQEHAFDNYKKYQSNSDYALKSSIDNVTSALDRMPASAQGGRKNLERIYRDMTDEEKAMANYLASSDNTKEFTDYMMNMSPVVDKRIYEQKVKEKEDYSGSVGHDIALSAQHVGENLIGTVGSWGDYLNAYAHGYTPNPYGGAAGMGNLAQEDLRIVSNDIGNEVGSFLYNTGMSTIDSAIGAAIFGEAYAPLMGTAAFNTTYKDLSEKGASKEEILLGAGLAGAAETVFEKVSIENLIKAKPNLKNMKNLATEIIKQAGIEASEEYFTELSNIITDELTQGANSEVSLMYRDLQNKGLSEDEINKEVAKELSKRVGEAALGGLISGGLMGGMFNYGQYRSNTNIGKNTDRAELSQAIENLNPESEVAKEYKGKDLTNLKDTEIGALVMDAYNQADVDAREKYQNAVRSGLENLGLSEGEVKDFYDAIFAEKPSKVQKLLKENETIKNLMSEINRTIAPEIAESARQNKYDIAKTVSNRQGVAKALKKSDLKVGAVTELNGEEVKVTDVIKDGDKITVVTNKGEADPAQLTLSAKDANLVMIASGMENNTMRKAYLNNYHGQNVAEYTDSFSIAYSYGKNGVTEETLLEDIGQTINLSIEDATNIYQQGASEIKKSSNEVIETSEEIKKIMKGFRKGTFDDSKIDKKKLSASQRGAYALAQLWLDLGINVSLFNDTSEDSENGYYKDGTIYINLSARYTKQNLKFDRGYVINTMAHELTHWMEDTDSEAFKALKTAIFNYYGEEKTNRLVAQEQQRYEKNTNKTMSKKAAESEVIARACEDMLSNSDTIERILMGVNADTRNTIVTKIREFIDRLGEFLNKILHGNMSPSEASRMLHENAEEFERVRKLWADTFAKAVNKVQQDTETLSNAGIEILDDGIAYNQKTLSESWLAASNESQVKEVAKILAKYLGVTQKKAQEYVRNLHTIANIEANNVALQYEDTGLSSWVTNSEYGGNFDFSYLCPKRLVYTGTVAEIRKHFNKMLTPTRFLAIRRFLIDAGHEAPCAYCYVESRRIHTDKYIQEKFIDKYPQYNYTLAQLTDPDFLEKMRSDSVKGIDNGWDKLQKALNIGASRARNLEKRRAYRGEILNNKEFTKDKVMAINLARGLRFFAFSDFEVPHLLDLMQIITDMSVRRLAGFAYTKQANFVEVFGGTGLKINMSCVAKGVDENGKIIFDDVEGMNSSDAIRLRQKYSKDVGIVCVVFTDEQVKAAMADDRIDYILPFHSSGFSSEMYSLMGLPKDTKDFTKEQTEKWGDETTSNKDENDKALKIPVSEFLGAGESGRAIAQRYLDIINEKGYTPLFPSALEHVGGEEIVVEKGKNKGKHKAWKGGKWVLPEGAVGDGYYKLIIEQKMFDNDGNPSPQRPVLPDFDMEAATKITTEFDENPNTFPVAHDVVDKFLEWEKNGEPLFSNKVDVDSLGRELSKGQIKKFKDSKAVDKDGDLQVVYHGTVREFYTFDRQFANAEGDWGKGFYFSNNEDDVEANYANEEGADLTNKIEHEADMLYGTEEYEDKEHDEIVEELKKKYITSDPITLECYLDIKNPCYMHTTILSYDDLEVSQDDYEDEDDYYDALDTAYYEFADDLYNKMYDLADYDMSEVFDSQGNEIMGFLHEMFEYDGISVREFKTKINEKWFEGVNGELVNNEIARLIIQALGYDGIIDDTVSKKFKNMEGMNEDTVHYIVFDSNQAKLTDNLNPTESEDIRYSIKDDGFEEKDSKTLGLTDERIDKLLSGGYYGSTQQNYAQAYITYMSPDDFLKLTTGKNQRALERIKDWQNSEWNDTERPAFSMDEFANTYDYQPIQLNIDEENHEVIGHEGRHRMWQIKQLGYNRVPVLLFNYDNKYTKTPIVGMDLMPQWFSEKDDSLNEFDKVIVRDLIPFSQGNRDLIKKKFGTESEADYKFNKKVDAEDLLGRNKRLEKENKALEADVQALKDYINANAELSEGKTWNPVDLNSVAKSLADKSKSNIDLKALRKQLASAYTYITEQLSSGNESWEDIMDECYTVASSIYDEIKNKPTLSKTRISNEIKKAGVNADAEVVSQVQDIVTEASKEDFLRHLAVEVYNGYWKASTLKTSADITKEKVAKVKDDKTKLKQLSEKQQDKIKQLKFEHRKTMDWMLAEQKLADEMHYSKIVNRVREDRDTKLKQLKQYVKDRDARLKDAAERRKLITKITDVSQDLGKRLLNAEKGRKVPDVLKEPLAELLNAIDFSSQRMLGIKGGKDMFKPTQKDVAISTLIDKVRMAVDRFNNGDTKEGDDVNYDFNNLHLPVNFTQELDEIKDNLRTVEDAVGEHNVYTLQYMSTEELARLYEVIKVMRKSINNMNKIISTNNAHEVDYLGNEIMTYLDNIGERKFENAVTNFMSIANKTPFYFFKHLGRGGQETFSFLQNGWDKLAVNVEEIKDFTHGKDGKNPLYTAKEYEKWKNTVRTYTVQEPTEEGMKERTFNITEAQMMSLYCLAKREQAAGHIKGDGIIIDSIKTKAKYGKHDIKRQDTVHLIESELAKILDDVKKDDRMRTVADALQNFMNTTCAEWGNEVTQKLYGTDEYTEKNYFPIHVNQDILASEAKDKSKSIYGMLNQSFTKPLVEGARNEINVSDIFDVFASHTGDMAKYNALALPIMDVIKVWNYKEQVDIGDKGSRDVKGVKKSITKAIGKAGNAYIGHLLRDLNGDAESGRYDKATMRLMKNYKTAAVAANLQTALLQPLSYIRAGYMVNGKYLRLALLKKPQVKKCLENIGVQKWKALGFYDTNLNIGLDRIISNGNTWMDNFIEKSLWLTEKMDEITWGYLYTAVELETKDKYPTLSGDKLNEVVAKRLRDVLYGTQVFDSTLSRTDMMRSKSTLVQMETAFGAEPILSVNMLMDAVTSFNQEKKQNGKASAMKKYAKLIGRAGLIYLLSSVVESVLRGVLGKLRKYDDDNKDRFEDIQQDILERTLEELDVLNKIPIVKDAMPYIRKFVLSKIGMGKNIYLDNAQMNEEVFNTIYQALNGIYKVLDGGEMNYKTFEKIFKAVSEATGLPISNVLKELKTIYNNTIGDATGNMWK